MMVRTRIFQCAPILATALMVSSTANAYTPEQEQMCTGDAFRLCSSEIPDVDRVTACMVRQRSQLSPGCRALFRETEPEPRPVVRSKPVVIKPHKAAKARKSHKAH